MRHRWAVLPIALGLVLGTVKVRGAEVGIEFTGMMTEGKEVRLALKSAASGASSWVAIGQNFEGYVVQSYDERSESVAVTKDGKEFRLRLVAPKVSLGRSEPPPEVKQKILRNLRMLAAAADQFYLERGVNRASYDDLVGATKYVKEVVAVDGEDYRSIEFAQARELQVKTRDGHAISYRP